MPASSRRPHLHAWRDTLTKVAGIYAATVHHVVRNPRHLPMLVRWFRERHASPLDLRAPWWPYSLAPWLAEALPMDAEVFEFGSGGSTLWLADRGYRVSSIESNSSWYATLLSRLPPSVDLRLVPPEPTGSVSTTVEPGYFDRYVATIDEHPDGSLDLVIVDGRCRVDCARRAGRKLRPGGLLMLDDSDRARYRPLFEDYAGWRWQTWLAPRPGRMPPGPSTIWFKPQ